MDGGHSGARGHRQSIFASNELNGTDGETHVTRHGDNVGYDVDHDNPQCLLACIMINLSFSHGTNARRHPVANLALPFLVAMKVEMY